MDFEAIVHLLAGVATRTTLFAGITPGSYSSGIGVSFAGDSNSTAISATAALVVQDAPIVSNVTASGLGNIRPRKYF